MNNDTQTISIARHLVSKYQTRDPEEIAEALGVQIMRVFDFKRQKGSFKIILNVPFIFVNGNLSEELQRMVIAHELGHAILHKDICLETGGMLEFELFDMVSQAEYDANIFQATLLIDENELLDYLHEGYDIVSIAKMLGVNINLLILKIASMAEEDKEYDFKLPYVPRRDFLGTIEDNAGEL
ncbi:MAG: ImmA/IrrE family metallo-endopeptidase [Oscillospiraceae bacterium]|nr:ImmA/IrrE family metallo-endopeptidase [Oscillospiraceae bacterium]